MQGGELRRKSSGAPYRTVIKSTAAYLVQCSGIQYSTGAVQRSAAQCSAVQCSTVKFNELDRTAQCSTVKFNELDRTVQYSTVQ